MARVTEPESIETPIDGLVERTRAEVRRMNEGPQRRLRAVVNLRAGRNAVLRRAREQLAADAGPDDPEVSALDARIVANLRYVVAGAVESMRASAPEPSPDTTEWVLHGWVRRASDDVGVPGVTVALYQDGARIEGISCDETDSGGRYRIGLHEGRFVPVDASAGSVEKERDATTSASKKGDAGVPLAARILDGSGKCLLDPPDRFIPILGTADLLEVRLPEGVVPPPKKK